MSQCYDENECHDRNHAGLMSYAQGHRLGDGGGPEKVGLTDLMEWMGQDVAAVVHRVAWAMEILRSDLAKARADVVAASGELLLPIPEPGTDAARVLIANRVLRNEVVRLRGKCGRIQDEARRWKMRAIATEKEAERHIRQAHQPGAHE